MRSLSISAITKQIQSSLFYINRFCTDTVTIAQSAIQHRPSNRIDFRNLLHRISTDTDTQDHDQYQNGNYLARQLLLLDKEIVYLEYEGFQTFLMKKIHLWKIKYYGNSNGGNIQNGEIGTESENESESQINDIPIRTANANKSENKIGKIAFMITKQQKNILGQELLYTRTQIKSFKPIEALLIVEHGLIMNGDIDDDNNHGAAVANIDGGIDTSNASAAHWRHELDRLLFENDQIMDQQQQHQKQQLETEDEMQANMQIQEILKRQQEEKKKQSRHDDSTNTLQNTTSSVLLGFEQPLAPNFAPSTRYVHDNDNKDKSYALAIVTDSVNDNGGRFPANVSTDVSTEATASQPISETEAKSYIFNSGRDKGENISTKEVGWYEVVQFSKLSVAASSHSTEVVALYRTRKEAEEFLDIKTDLVQKRLKQEKGRSGDHYEQGIEYRVQKRKS